MRFCNNPEFFLLHSMKFSALKLAILLLVLPFLVASCSEDNLLKKIPGDADLVVFVDFKKIAFQSLDLSMLFSGSTSSDKKNGEWKDSGIDFLGRAVLFSRSPKDESRLYYLMIPLSDSDQFRQFCRSQGGFREGAEGNEVWLEKGRIRIHLKEKEAMVIISKNQEESDLYQSEATALQSLREEDNLLSASEKFAALCGENKATGIWMRSLESLASDYSLYLPPAYLQAELTGSADFPAGELLMEAELSTADSASSPSILGEPINPNLTSSCLNQINASGLAAFSLSMPGLRSALKLSGFDESASLMASAYGISLQEITDVFSGQVAMATGKTEPGSIPPVRVLLGLKTSPALLLQKLGTAGLLLEKGKGEYAPADFPYISIIREEDYLSIQYGAFTEGSPEESLLEFSGSGSGQFMLSLNLSDLPGNIEKVENSAIIKDWKTIRFLLSKKEERKTSITCRLVCSNEKESSLAVLLRSLKPLAGKADKNQAVVF